MEGEAEEVEAIGSVVEEGETDEFKVVGKGDEISSNRDTKFPTAKS